ncbi:peptidoglycan hydrolase CwlO-like protein [Streptomyces sp. HB202]|nr:peptidoglycan hydrolase CwlO-like protein [Streptomyces sp. HB202]
MPVLASHRKPRTKVRTTTPAVGLTTAALASVTLLSTQSATAAPAEPKPAIEDVQKKVDALYRQAGSATQEYNRAKAASSSQQKKVDTLLADVAKRTEKINEARRSLGSYAAAQYRSGGIAPTATFFLADDPQGYFDQSRLMDRATERQQKAVTDFRTQQASAAKKRAEAVKSLETLTETQATLSSSKKDVQAKLTEARGLLSRLTAEEKARLAELERKKEAEAKEKAAKLAARQAAEAEAKAEAEEKAREEAREGVRRRFGIRIGHGSGVRLRRGQRLRRQGGEGAGLRPRPDREAVRLGGDGPLQLRLLGADPGGLAGGGRDPAPDHLGPGRGRHAGRHVRPPARGPGLLLRRHQPRRHLQGRRDDDPRPEAGCERARGVDLLHADLRERTPGVTQGGGGR